MKKTLTFIVSLILACLTALCFTACSTESTSTQKVKTLGIDLTSEQYGIAVKKGDAQMLASVNAFLTDKATEINEIMDKYLAEGVDLNDSTKFGTDAIKTEIDLNADNELVVATNLDFAPFEYKIGNKIAGIDMEVAQLLANYLNKTLVVVHMDFDAVVTSVQTKAEYDIGFAGLTINEERLEMVDFSNAYIDSTQTLVLKADDQTFADCTTKEQVEAKFATLTGNAAKCGGQTATTSMFYIQGSAEFEYSGFENLTFGKYASAAEAVQDMLNGNIAFVVVDKATANSLVASFNN